MVDDTLLSLVAALDADSGLEQRLSAALSVLSRVSGAATAIVLSTGGAQVLAATGGESHDAATALELCGAAGRSWPLGDAGTLVASPAEACEAASATLGVGAELIGARLRIERLLHHAERREQELSFLVHEMNNSLVTLLCHSAEPVVREATRLRGHLETLRHLRGRMRLRNLIRAPAFLERAWAFLRYSREGVHAGVVTECASAAEGRTLGPEQEVLLKHLLEVGYVLRQAGDALVLRASVHNGCLRLDLDAETSSPVSILAELDLPQTPVLRTTCAVLDDRVRVSFDLIEPPRIVLFHGPTPPDAAREALEAMGLRVHLSSVPAEAADLVTEQSLVAVTEDARAEGSQLRGLLFRRHPTVAMQMSFLGQPSGGSFGPGEVDLTAL
ncbi:MAG: hypothetical protein HN750_00485 [Gemmatimonadales bacterium]|nr:hypothetical protein [Gemmatimonadales bacterium]